MILHPAAPREPWFGPAKLGPALVVAPLVLAAVSTAASVYGGVKQSQQSAAMSAYQQGVAKNNQILADRAATQTEQEGAIDQANSAEKTRQLIGTQRATFAANGVLVDSGSALDTTTDTAGLGELDQLNIGYNTAQKAAALRYQGAQYGSAAGYDSSTGFDYGGAISNIGSVASKWYDYGNTQGWFDSPSAAVSSGSEGAEIAGFGSSY